MLEAVKREARLFLDRDKLSKQVNRRSITLSKSERIDAIIKSIAVMQNSWMVLYEKYADGELNRDFFICEKKKYDADVRAMEEQLAILRQAQQEEETTRKDSEKKVFEAMTFLEEEELTEDMKEKLIEKVLIYPNSRMEIVWEFEETLKCLIG